ncbi:cation diffusion facilitator family transporter [Caldivirga sp. UBA161]|uniref:cation diffusion facilitator family transporter n=1 Tax=Caldivirga sp. UBA161 TaxID=1915569 RepID=UPI0025BEC64A|nr:cation diffusion facilitator family transporter [Caldivirga sp. UBA161]
MNGKVRFYVKVATLLVSATSIIELLTGVTMNIPVLIADGLHTMLDVVILSSLYIGLGPTLKPPDMDHPYGHFKYKYLSMYTVAIILMGASLWLVAESIINITKGIVEKLPLDSLYIIIIVASLVLSRLINLRIGYIKTGDLILKLEFRHAIADLLDALLIAAVMVVSLMMPIIQPIAVLAIAAYLIYLGVNYFKESMNVLLDQINPEITNRVYSIARYHNVSVSDVKVKNTGNGYAIDLIVKVPGWYSVNEAHRIVDELENDIMKNIQSVVSVNTHVEPG